MSHILNSTDLVLATVGALLAALAVAFLPAGAGIRLLSVLPLLLLIPGYLLIEALVVRPRTRRAQWVHVGVALGVSPALIGLLALATAVIPGGFRASAIVIAVTAACLLLAGVAFYRRVLESIKVETTDPGQVIPAREPSAFAGPLGGRSEPMAASRGNEPAAPHGASESP